MAHNRGFLYGDGFFESILLIHNNPLYNKHFERINATAWFLNLTLDPIFTDFPSFLDYLYQIKSDHSQPTKLRINFYREGESTYLPSINQAKTDYNVAAITNPLNVNNRVKSKVSVSNRVTIYSKGINQYKTLNKLPQVMASIEANERECDDLIVLNEKNGVCEMISSNIFIVKNNRILTPALDEGSLKGTFRDYLIGELRNCSLNVEETDFGIDTLAEADEIFTTNAIEGIVPIKSVDGKIYSLDFSFRLKSTLFSNFKL